MGFKTVAIAAVAMVVYEAAKKVVELHGRLEELRTASERESAELLRFTDQQKLANDALQVSNDRLEKEIAHLQGRPRNNLKLAIDEAAESADRLAGRLDKALRSFYEVVQKNAPGFFAQILGRQPGTEDIQELIGGKSGFGGMIGELYKSSSQGGDPVGAIAKYRSAAMQKLRESEYAQAYQSGTSFEGHPWGYNYPTPNSLPVGMKSVDVTQVQGPRIEVLNALIRQMDLLTQSYGLEQRQKSLESRKAGLEGITGASASEHARQFEELQKRSDESNLGPVQKLIMERDKFLTQSVKLGETTAQIAREQKVYNDLILDARVTEHVKDLNAHLKSQDDLVKDHVAYLNAGLRGQEDQVHEHVAYLNAGLVGQRNAAAADEQIAAIDLASRRENLNRRARAAPARVSASGMTGVDAITATYQIRMDLANRLSEIEAQRIVKEKDADQRRIQGAHLLADVRKEAAEAEQERSLKLMELEHQRYESLKKDTEGLWTTLLTHPDKFGKELGSTLHAAVIHPIAEGMAGLTAKVLQPVIYGQNGQGGIAGLFHGAFGGSGKKDIAVVTDRNTDATVENTSWLRRLCESASGGAAGGASGSASIMSLARSPVAASMAMLAGMAGMPMASAASQGGYAPTSGAYSAAALTGEAFDLPTTSHAPSIEQLVGGHAGGGDWTGGSAGAAAGGRGLQLPGMPKLTGGLAGIKRQLWNSDWNNGDGSGTKIQSGTLGGDLKGVMTSQGAASLMMASGIPLAMAGLTGSHKGTWTGMAESTAGGAMAGAGIGTMIMPGIGTAIGAGIGAAAGLVSSGMEKLLGIVSPEQKAHDDVSSIYHVSIPTSSGTIKQIVGLAQSQYGGNIAVAVRSPSVRQLVMLYSEATGQKMPMSASTPYAGSLVESGGNLYQQATWQDGQAHTYASNLPTLGGIASTNYPSSAGANTSGGAGLNASIYINGQAITPEFVADSSMSAQGSSYNRTQMSANMQVPGLMVGS
jgi:hypothetical protein